MEMLKIASIILSVEACLQFLVSVLSLIVSLFGKYAPILKMTFTNEELLTLDEKYITTTKALAIMHNAGATIGTFFFLVIIWACLIKGHKWAFWILLIAGIFGHIFWFIGDRYIGNQTFIVNSILTALFLVGIGLAGYGIYTR
jgi:hypothetical protein